MARRTLWQIADDPDLPMAQSVARVAIRLFAAGVAAVLGIVWVAIWCWEQHWLLGLVATVCPIIGLYYTVTKEPSR